MWDCSCSWAGISAVTCTGESNNLRSHVSLGFSHCRSDLSNGVLAASGSGDAGPEGSTEGSSHIVWPANLSCRAHCLLLTETTLQREALERFFHVPLQNQLLEEGEQCVPRPLQLLIGLFTGRLEMAPTLSLGRLKFLSLTGRLCLPTFPSLQADLGFAGMLSAMNPVLC